MKLLNTLFLLLCCCTFQLLAQDSPQNANFAIKKGRIYTFWGWNRGHYSNSDITINGEKYNFVLKNVVAKDRPSPVELGVYLNPVTLTIPQTNFRVGYFIKDGWDLSLGFDHMKYVMQNGQTVKISGTITGTDTEYDGVYDNEDIVLYSRFFKFEHTDGLNYINLQLARHFDLLKTWKNHPRWLGASAFGGLGAGVLVPRTDSKLLNNEEWDKFHLAGYGIAPTMGININFFHHFFIQSEFKGGYIGLPSVRVTSNANDNAKQSFFFTQNNILFGWNFSLGK